MAEIVPFQPELSPELPHVVGNVDYQEYEKTLFHIEEILESSGVEQSFVECRLDEYEAQSRVVSLEEGKAFRQIPLGELGRVVKHAMQAFRCNIAMELTGEDCRRFSTHLAESALLRRFCLIDGIAPIKVPSKSTIDRLDLF